MKGKENPSLILAFHGMLGRKKQTSLLLILLTMVFSFLTAATIYSGSSAQALQDTRCELYGEWQYLRLSDTDTDAAQVRDNLPASAKASTAIQNGIVLGADNGMAGGIGTVDSAFAQLGRIVPISGNFPAQPDEIAMTTTLLDALGCSYDLGQTITLKVADNDYDPLSGSGKIVEQTYTLCGVLPAYDVYWNLGSNLTVSAVVVEPLALTGQKFQTFYDLNADTVGTASDDPDFIANEYAYPQEDTVSSSLTFLLMIAILVSFFAVAQYFVIVLHKRVQTLHTFQILGARKLTPDVPVGSSFCRSCGSFPWFCTWVWCCCHRAWTAKTAFVLCGSFCIVDPACRTIFDCCAVGRIPAGCSDPPKGSTEEGRQGKKVPFGAASACTAGRCRLCGLADRSQLPLCRMACHAAV